MNEPVISLPPRNRGLVLHSILLVLLLGGISALLILIVSQQAGFLLILMLIGVLILIGLVPFAVYRGYALMRAYYEVDRDGLRIHWGLRGEDIPMTEVIWVRQAEELGSWLQLPPFSVPGAILGGSIQADLGNTEFIASEASSLVVVSTTNRNYVLSPDNPAEFVRVFQRLIEMGSLSPTAPASTEPAAFVRRIWDDRLTRGLVLANLVLALLLLILTSLLIPLRAEISLGFDLNRSPLPTVSSSRLLLLPVLGVAFTAADLILGFFYSRKEETRLVPYFIWGAGVLSSLFMLVSILVLFLSTGV
ncbi:MAG TPA: PH domain-containing protein [Anaerolineaceae bacterium]|nr:PH domain-containing protein [Anaerolineaceae bacterium]